MSDDLMNVSLNALRTLQTVYRLKGISAAADALDVQQPSVSYTIDRLRKTFGDPLFLRMGRGIAPTDRCSELMESVNRILHEAEALSRDDFDPAQSTARVTIMSSGFSLNTLVPALIRRATVEAPSVTLDIQVGHVSTAEVLLDRAADIVLSGDQPDVKGIQTRKGILLDRGVCLMDASNPLCGKRLTRSDVENGRFVVPMVHPGFKSPFIRAAEAAGIAIPHSVTVGDLMTAALLLSGTNLMTGLPWRMASKFSPELATARFPFDVHAPLHMHWAATADRSPLNMWMRNIIVEEAAKLGPPVDI